MSARDAVSFLALLAYPENGQRRLKAEEAMRAYFLRCCRDAGTLKELGQIMPVQQQDGQFRRLKARLEKRLIAANDCMHLELGLTATEESRREKLPESQWEEVTQREMVDAGVEVKTYIEKFRIIDGPIFSLNRLAAERDAATVGATKYKSDVWRPAVMHLGIALREVALNWRSRPSADICSWPFSLEALILLWPDWIHAAKEKSALIEVMLRNSQQPALRGFKNTAFLYP